MDNQIDQNLNVPSPTPIQRNINHESRYCWICSKDEEDRQTDDVVEWTKPCKCEGTFGWVHQSCLQLWIDILQKGNSFRRVKCLLCKTEYIIDLPSMGFLADVLEFFDILARHSYPALAAGCLFKSLYFAATLYGLVTVRQVGWNGCIHLCEPTIFTMVALPAIPVCLVLCRMISWEDYIILFLQNRQILQRSDYDIVDNDRIPARNSTFDQFLKLGWFCFAFLIPSISSVIGRVFFSYVSDNFRRTLLGGLTFIAVKGGLQLYLKVNQLIKKKQRKIVDYTDQNIRRYHNHTEE